MDRYIRQTTLPQIGQDGQAKLGRAHVCVVGCGALGSVVANNLARAGIGHLTIIDRDSVDESNLQRQILFTEADAREGAPKSRATARVLRMANSEIKIDALQISVTKENVRELIKDADVVVDATDNMDARYIINDACAAAKKPWVMCAVAGMRGMSMTVVPGTSACLRCWMSEPPPKADVPTAVTHGITNGITSIIGSIGSIEAMKLIVGSADINKKLLEISIWPYSFREFTITKRSDCICSH